MANRLSGIYRADQVIGKVNIIIDIYTYLFIDILSVQTERTKNNSCQIDKREGYTKRETERKGRRNS